MIRAMLASGLMVTALPCHAEGAEVTPRRITVAPMDGRPRITVQIDPVEQARALAPLAAAVPASRRAPATEAPVSDAGRYDWFWEAVPSGLAQSNGRFLTAMAALASAPENRGVPQPSLQHLQDIAAAQGAHILGSTVGTRVSPALVLAVIAVESAGRTRATSHAGAQGLMQLIPATAERFGVQDSMDPAQNIRGGVAYLDWLLTEFDGDVVLALAGYNAGEGAVRRNGGVPPYAETRDYVPKVLAAWSVARGLCATPPELPSDGCVFAVRTARAG